MVERVQSKRRRVMKDFRITELSAVDSPAQKHARAVFMKRADEPQEQDMDFEKITYARERPLSFATLGDCVSFLMGQQGYSRLDAMEKVARDAPDLVEKFNREGEAIAKSIAEANAPRPVAKAVADFDKRVAEIQARDRCSKLAALEKAAREYPAEFSAYQEA